MGIQVRDFAPIQPPISWTDSLRLLATCLLAFTNSFIDITPIVLLPYIQKDYRISHAITSLILVSNTLGYLVAAPFTRLLDRAVGRSNAFGISQGVMGIGFLLIAGHSPFPITVVAYFLVGLGLAISWTLSNVYCTSLGEGETTPALGLLHGCYGVGAVGGYSLATSLMVRGITWCHFYLVLLLLTILNTVVSSRVFRSYENEFPDQCFVQSPHYAKSTDYSRGTPWPSSSSIQNTIFNRSMFVGTLFIFAYAGAEISMSGSILENRSRENPHPSVSFTALGFWVGMSFGRFFFALISPEMGDEYALCILLQVIVWYVHGFAGDGVLLPLIGFLFGPILPNAIAVYGRLFPGSTRITGFSFILAIGRLGGTLSFILGQRVVETLGTGALHSICVMMGTVMLFCWLALPCS
ncbi:major facilitator superfamily domain-containing protein [Pseudomassariella vexata]|uniref:Major facilitator superfamily domain-containing protein n=1 Tax=Pseudomassariella vexata TaxID=1141098 RepID=A0A1Y2DHT3_9PEZI|nr:major facilitator superfamily domain-containing protein [Pseudomassariella vexata]ORY58801.1 major facilitator superfamily domain-containing protein [Pseudomassariella vexata]